MSVRTTYQCNMCFKLIKPSLGAERLGCGFLRDEAKITWVTRAGAHICHPCLEALRSSSENFPSTSMDMTKEC